MNPKLIQMQLSGEKLPVKRKRQIEDGLKKVQKSTIL